MRQTFLLSLLFPLLALAQQQSGLPPAGYNGGPDTPQDPSDAGADGTQTGGFSLSKGAIIAIIVVAFIVVVIGIGSATLWWLAKKRQWDVRQSLRRASRRFTGRTTTNVNKDNRRTGIRLDSPPPGKRAGNRKNEGRDIEKGLSLPSKDTKTTTTISSVKK